MCTVQRTLAALRSIGRSLPTGSWVRADIEVNTRVTYRTGRPLSRGANTQYCTIYCIVLYCCFFAFYCFAFDFCVLLLYFSSELTSLVLSTFNLYTVVLYYYSICCTQYSTCKCTDFSYEYTVEDLLCCTVQYSCLQRESAVPEGDFGVRCRGPEYQLLSTL